MGLLSSIVCGSFEYAQEQLENDPNIDFLEEDNELIIPIIKSSIDYSNIEFIEFVFSYFDNQLSQYDHYTHEAVIMRQKMRNAVMHLVLDISILDKVSGDKQERLKQMLSKYYDFSPEGSKLGKNVDDFIDEDCNMSQDTWSSPGKSDKSGEFTRLTHNAITNCKILNADTSRQEWLSEITRDSSDLLLDPHLKDELSSTQSSEIEIKVEYIGDIPELPSE